MVSKVAFGFAARVLVLITATLMIFLGKGVSIRELGTSESANLRAEGKPCPEGGKTPFLRG